MFSNGEMRSHLCSFTLKFMREGKWYTRVSKAEGECKDAKEQAS